MTIQDIERKHNGIIHGKTFSRNVESLTSNHAENASLGVYRWLFFVKSNSDKLIKFGDDEFMFQTVESFSKNFDMWKSQHQDKDIPEQDFIDYKNFLLDLIPDEFKTK